MNQKASSIRPKTQTRPGPNKSSQTCAINTLHMETNLDKALNKCTHVEMAQITETNVGMALANETCGQAN